MFGFFKKDPVKKLKQKYEDLLATAMQRQRNGDIEGYSKLTEEANAVLAQIDEIEAQKKSKDTSG